MTFNTHNALGSVDDRDVQDNAANLDLAVNSLALTFEDRLGVTRDTLEGIYQKSAYYRAGAFAAGYTLTNNRQTLAYGNVDYGWAGSFPKVVAAGATPETSGGIGAGAWVDRTDVTLRDEIPLISNKNLFYNSKTVDFTTEDIKNFTQGSIVNKSDFLLFNNEIWRSLADNQLCGPAPVFGEFYKAKADGEIHVENCGNVISDADSAIINAIAAAKINDKKEIYLNSAVSTAASQLDGVGDVTFFGSGSIEGLYSVSVFDGDEPEFSVAGKNEFIALENTQSPVVVVVGDSISAHLPNAINTSQTLYSLICEKFSKEFPKKAFTFYNRAIGGQTIGNFDSVAYTNVDAPWYTIGTNWFNYISSLAPDVIVLHFGMNETTEDTYATWASVISKINALPKVPDIVILNNMLPTRETEYGDYATYNSQRNRDLTAGVQRSLANHYGLNLIDFNRQFHAVRDGFDIFNTNMLRVDTFISPSANTHVASKKTMSDFAFNLYIATTKQADILAMFDRSSSPFYFRIGAGENDVVFINNRDENYSTKSSLYLHFYCGSVSNSPKYSTVATGIPIPTTSFALRVTVRGNEFSVSVSDNDPNSVFRYEKMIRNFGYFYPSFGYFQTPLSPTLTSKLDYDVGIPQKVKRVHTDSELFGQWDGTGDTKYPAGGNAINHPSSVCVASVFKKMLDSVVFVLNETQFTQSSETVSLFFNGFYSTDANMEKLRVAKNGIITTISGCISNANGEIATGTGICTIPVGYRPGKDLYIPVACYHTSTTDFQAGTIKFDHVSGTLQFINGPSNVVGINFSFIS